MNALGLWLIGLLLIFLEFYLPGAILGILGGLFVFASLLIYASQSASPLATLSFSFAVIASVVLIIRFALWRIRTARPENSILFGCPSAGTCGPRNLKNTPLAK